MNQNIWLVDLLIKTIITDSIVEQTETKAQKKLGVKITKSGEASSFDKTLQLEDGDWLLHIYSDENVTKKDRSRHYCKVRWFCYCFTKWAW